MSHFDARVERPDIDIQPAVQNALHVDDVPARRLLAHDLEHMVWDDEGERPLPPPD